MAPGDGDGRAAESPAPDEQIRRSRSPPEKTDRVRTLRFEVRQDDSIIGVTDDDVVAFDHDGDHRAVLGDRDLPGGVVLRPDGRPVPSLTLARDEEPAFRRESSH